MRRIRVPILRWPGRCFVSSYHWKDAVGPERKPLFDKAWRVEDPNTFGTDEYLAKPGENGGFLLKHSCGFYLKNSEIDVPLTYADYYFLEALHRYNSLK